MKTVFALALAWLVVPVFAATNLLNLTYVNGTNTGNVFWVSNVFVPKQTFLIQSLGITNGGYSGSYTTNGITNALTVNIQLSVDGGNSNWLTIATWTPHHTNALVDSYEANFGRITLPLRAQVITTNAIGVSVFQK